jgi:hypothetical protein
MTEEDQQEEEEEECGHCIGCLLNKLLQPPAETDEGVIFEDDNYRIVSVPVTAVNVHELLHLLDSLISPPSDEGEGMLIEELLDQSTLDYIEKQKAKAKR